jgi:RimJ/RimL family protein N-acetyltransferase
MHAPALLGDLVRLRTPERADSANFVRWFSDRDLLHWLHLSEGPQITEGAWLKNYDEVREDPGVIVWVIETLDGVPIGHLGLNHIDPIHFRATLFISISEKDRWGQGYGTDAIRLVLRDAFERQNLRRVDLITDADNARGIRCYEKCGFVREGLLRGHRLRYGKPLDMVQMGVMREDFR